MTDREIRGAVLREIERDLQVKSTAIGVSVKDGIVALSGFVDSDAKRYNAERAAKRVYGVKAVVNELEVKLPLNDRRTEKDENYGQHQASAEESPTLEKMVDMALEMTFPASDPPFWMP